MHKRGCLDLLSVWDCNILLSGWTGLQWCSKLYCIVIVYWPSYQIVDVLSSERTLETVLNKSRRLEISSMMSKSSLAGIKFENLIWSLIQRYSKAGRRQRIELSIKSGHMGCLFHVCSSIMNNHFVTVRLQTLNLEFQRVGAELTIHIKLTAFFCTGRF